MEKFIRQATANISAYFAKKYRITILIFIALIAFGFASYTSLLKREGFPSVDVPIVIVNTPYFVDDAETVNQEATEPIENIILGMEDVVQVTSTTSANRSSIVVEFPSDFTAEEGKEIVRDEIDKSTDEGIRDLPITYATVDASRFMGKYDFVLTLRANKPIEELQEKARIITQELVDLHEVHSGETIELLTTETNPETGEEFTFQDKYNRSGLKNEDGELIFKQAISIGLVKQNKADAIELSETVRNRIQELTDDDQLEDYDVVYTTDIAEQITQQISSLEDNAIVGLIAVTIIVFLFIGWRASILAALFIPTVMTATFLALYVGGYSLNVISLFSLILVLGLFVDDAIVVVDAIDYEIRQGKRGITAIKAAISNISIADIAGTITTILVFVPMLFTSGILGEFIRLIPITVIISLTISIIIALTITTFFAGIILTRIPRALQKDPANFANLSNVIIVRYDVLDFILKGPNRLVEKIGKWLSLFVDWYLEKTWRIIIVATAGVILVFAGIGAASQLKFSVFPSPKDTTQIMVTANFPSNTDIKNAESFMKEIENLLIDEAESEIEQVDYANGNENQSVLQIELTPIDSREKTAVQIIESIEDGLEDIETDEIRVRVEEISAGPPTSEYPFSMQVYSEDKDALQDAGNEIEEFMLELEIDGDEVIEDVVIDYTDTIAKRDGERFIQVRAKTNDLENTGLVLDIQEEIKSEFDEDTLSALGLNDDALGFDFGQESENIESFQSALVALVVALAAMYVLLIAQFNSFIQPILVFIAIPLSFPGLFPGLLLTNNSMSFFVAVGITGLVGIVVNNTIMLVDYANQLRTKSIRIRDAIVEAVRVRFRPIIATSATTIAGLTPLALSDPFWESLAFAIIFGLISSTILVITVFPAYYTLAERIRRLKYILHDIRKFIIINGNSTDDLNTQERTPEEDPKKINY